MSGWGETLIRRHAGAVSLVPLCKQEFGDCVYSCFLTVDPSTHSRSLCKHSFNSSCLKRCQWQSQIYKKSRLLDMQLFVKHPLQQNKGTSSRHKTKA